jgi:DNA-binding transcriptional regulator/RsmH inhibitor MraZ
MTQLPLQRLSPKNQVTLPREARAFLGVAEEAQVCGMQHRLAREGKGGGTFPILLLMTERELQRREQRILDDPAISPAKRFELVTKLNGSMRRMAVDAQHRAVLPPHFVSFLALERDVFFVCTNTTVQLWNPIHYLKWSGQDQDGHTDPELDAYLMI